MDNVLSEFVARTSVEPGLAHDLLNAHNWNLQSAVSAYYVMKGLLPGEVSSVCTDSAVLASQQGQKAKPLCEDIILNGSVPNQSYAVDGRNDHPDDTNKKLTRGFSRAIDNVMLINQARTEFAHDFYTFVHDENIPLSKMEIPDYTFTLPNLSVYPSQLQEFLRKDLIETSTLVSLEQAGRLNWWNEKMICQKLWPLATTGDGNCLLHAASLGMWGFHDRLLTLRKALHNLMTNSNLTDAFYRRWRWQTFKQNKEAGLIYCEEEWEREWQNLLRISSTEPRAKYLQNSSSDMSTGNDTWSEKLPNAVYESLEELHVFGLAHVLRRPIVVIADTLLKDVKGEPFAPIPFGGIYLPLECSPSECHRSPLCLTYDSAHFSALVPMDDNGENSPNSKVPTAVPVTDPENKLLPLHFAVDPGPEVKWDQDENDPWVVERLSLSDEDKLLLLNEYLDIRSFPLACSDENGVQTTFNGSATKNHVSEPCYDSDDSLAGSGISCTGSKSHKSKAARQLQTVAKQFGSIGKSVSKKLKHIGDIARRGGSFKGEPKAFRQVSSSLKNKRNLSGLPMISHSATVNGTCSSRQVIVALLHTEKKHEHQKQIIQNYLTSAILRYEKERGSKNSARLSDCSSCSNPECLMYGIPTTNYVCSSCFSKLKPQNKPESKRFTLQKQNRRPFKDNTVVSFGKSSFYTDSEGSSAVNTNTLEGRNSVLRWNSSEFYDNCPSKPLHSAVPYDCKERVFHKDERMMLNTLQESATS